LRRSALLFAAILAVLVAGTWTTVRLTTDYLLNHDAKETARGWASYLAGNVTDLEQIAAGEQPSQQSLKFFQAAHSAGHVFRYVIYNPEGYSQLVYDGGVTSVDISARSNDAVAAAATGAPVVDAEWAQSSDMPDYFAKAFVPVTVGGRTVAVVAAFVDQTAQR